jgi:hypothetical protein
MNHRTVSSLRRDTALATVRNPLGDHDKKARMVGDCQTPFELLLSREITFGPSKPWKVILDLSMISVGNEFGQAPFG